MSDKYIIKNCPVNYGLYKEMCGIVEKPEDIGMACKDCTNCVMKQIVELAKRHTELCRNCEQQIKECDCSDICNAYRLNKILQLLRIEEVE